MTQLVTTSRGSFRVRPAETWSTRALALVPLVDEWTQAPPPVATARSLTPRVFAHVTRGTLVLTGLPGLALPQLATADAVVEVVLARPGRPEQPASVRIPLGSALPYTAPPLAVSADPVAVTGRVSAAAFPHAPVAGATLSFSGPATGPLVAAAVPVGAAHAAGTTVRGRGLAAGATTTLTAPAQAGETVLALGSTAGIGAGTVLELATGEHVVAAATTGVLAVLRVPLRTSPAGGSAVTAHSLGATGAATTLARAAAAGDGVLPVATAITPATIEIVDGDATEYRALGLAGDADGRWRLAGVRGIAELVITTAAPGFLTDGPRSHPLAPLDPYVINTALKT